MGKSENKINKNFVQFLKKKKFDPLDYVNNYNVKEYQEIPEIDLKKFDEFLNKKSNLLKNFNNKIFTSIALKLSSCLRGTSFDINGDLKFWQTNKKFVPLNAWSKIPPKYWLGHFDHEKVI